MSEHLELVCSEMHPQIAKKFFERCQSCFEKIFLNLTQFDIILKAGDVKMSLEVARIF